MNTNKLVTAEDFYAAFIECWEKEALIVEDYSKLEITARTKFMLGGKGWGGMEDSFLHKVKSELCCGLRDRLNADGELLKMSREWYTLDAVFYSGNNLPGFVEEKGEEYPPLLDVLIEHENGGDVETEMWKLLQFRAPLKVIIFYDLGGDGKTKEKGQECTQWLPAKLNELTLMAMKTEHLWPENEDTEYLFIVGHRNSEDQLCWKKFSLNELMEKYCRYGSSTIAEVLDKRKRD